MFPSLATTFTPAQAKSLYGSEQRSVDLTSIPKQTLFRFIPATLPLRDIRVTSLYGRRSNPFTHRGSEFHPGVDFGMATGTPVYSTAAGVVSFTGYRGDYGQMIEVSHGLGFRTRYSHLSRINVHVGDVVDRNAIVGSVGSTGRSTGPHLYYEIWSQNVRVDPIAFILRANAIYQSR